MTKTIKRFMALFLTAIMAVTVLPMLPEGISVTAYADSKVWDKAYSYKGNNNFSVDKKTYYADSGYSIKIQNKNYDLAYVSKEFKVKKNTHYRASVMRLRRSKTSRKAVRR